MRKATQIVSLPRQRGVHKERAGRFECAIPHALARKNASLALRVQMQRRPSASRMRFSAGRPVEDVVATAAILQTVDRRVAAPIR